MQRRCEVGKETSGGEIRGGRRAGDVGWPRDVGKVRRHVRTQSALGMASGRWRRRRRINLCCCGPDLPLGNLSRYS